MASDGKRPLKAFLCHASGDKPPVRDLYKRLVAEGVDAWLDRERLLPGQDWRLEIPRAVKDADVVVVCLSNKSVTKEGYVQKEIKFALDSAEEKPEGTIFLIPARLEDCTVPERLSRWQWVDLYEENGFIQLLRSLKLRADAVGAAVEPTAYEDSDKEVEQRVDQLYTEGLAAFYTEDWDKACHRFQTILSERPNHRNAAEKLAESERQRSLSKLYAQASEAVRSEDWGTAIRSLEELSKKSADYKDAAQLLKNARKQKQLRELYAEAGKLHAAQKWQAVVKVFEQISGIDPGYPDPGGLLLSAQKEVEELKRLADLNDLYSHAVREMDAGQWVEARRLLEHVHKAQTGFLETERLLRKVEDEIAELEEQNRRQEQVNVLYEQAHGLLRSKKWRKALDKMEEIQGLDDRFVDRDEISEKAKMELAKEEAEAQREDELSARYAEAVRLLKEEKYQEALDKWQEVRAVDSKYPDRQWVQRTAKRKLSGSPKPIRAQPRLPLTKSMRTGLMGVLMIGVIVTGVMWFGGRKQYVMPTSTSVPIEAESSAPTATDVPSGPALLRPATATPTIRGHSNPLYDDFDDATYDGRYDNTLWEINTDSINFDVSQGNGKLSMQVRDKAGIGIHARSEVQVNVPTFFEVRLYLDPLTTNAGSHFFLVIATDDGYSNCGIFRTGDYAQQITCWSEYFGVKAETQLGLDGIQPGWHMIRFEIDPESMTIEYIVDSARVSHFDPRESIPSHFNDFKQLAFRLIVGLNNFGPSTAPVGYIDYVRMGAIDEDPVLFFDDFNGPVLNEVYTLLPANLISNYKGIPDYSFEMLDRSTVLRLRNHLQPGQSVGWQTNIIFHPDAFPARLEIRFNTMIQSRTTSIDGFLEAGLIDGSNAKYSRVGLFAGNYGRERTFANKPLDIKDNTWYRLVIIWSKGQDIRASLCDDKSGEVLAETSLGPNTYLFTSGIKIGLTQLMGTPDGSYPADVTIDWVRFMVAPTP